MREPFLGHCVYMISLVEIINYLFYSPKGFLNHWCFEGYPTPGTMLTSWYRREQEQLGKLNDQTLFRLSAMLATHTTYTLVRMRNSADQLQQSYQRKQQRSHFVSEMETKYLSMLNNFNTNYNFTITSIEANQFFLSIFCD